MKYRQIDRILALEPGRRLVGERTLAADETYLKDHFPRLPVMPGVMMLEALHQAAVWMVRTGEDFRSPLVLLREVRSVKFGDFLSPGDTLTVIAELKSEDGPLRKVRATGQKNGRTTVTAQIVLECCGTGDPQWVGTDDELRFRVRQQFDDLFGELAAIPREIDSVPAT